MKSQQSSFNAFAPPRCSGFTAIELMMVLSIIALLSGLAIPAALSSLRYATFTQAKSELIAIHEDARNLAILQGARHGVEVNKDGNRVVLRILSEDGAPVPGLERYLPGSVRFFSETAEISYPLQWFYRAGTGTLLARKQDAADEDPEFIVGMLGLPMPSVEESISGVLPQQIGGHSRIELATVQGDIRAGLSIFPIGFFSLTTLQSED